MKIFDKFMKRPASPANESESFLPSMEPETNAADKADKADKNAQDRRAAAQAAEADISAGDMAQESDGLPSVNRRRGSNKFINGLGIVFILVVGAALIITVNKPKSSIKTKALSESDRVSNTLPPLTMPAPPPPPALAAPVTATTAPGAQPIPLKNGSPQAAPAGPNGKPVVEWYDRKRAGDLMIGQAGSSATGPGSGAVGVQQVAGVPGSGASLDGNGGQRSDLALRLEPTVTRAASAALLPDRNYLITKGTTLDCALETALDSTVPGLTTCRLTRDVYSDNGQVVLLDRGSQLTGEYQGGIRQGQARIFTLWTRAKTPNGVVVALNSPSTDALGRSGLEGWVDTHFAARFGAAIMFSLLKDGLNVIAAKQQSSGGNQVVYGNTQQAGEQAVGKVLDSTINIPPTLIKNQGDHIQVMVARDLDFSSVYALRSKE